MATRLLRETMGKQTMMRKRRIVGNNLARIDRRRSGVAE